MSVTAGIHKAVYFVNGFHRTGESYTKESLKKFMWREKSRRIVRKVKIPLVHNANDESECDKKFKT